MALTLEQAETTQNKAEGYTTSPDGSRGKVTFEEYLAMGDEAYEWIDGEVPTMAPASYFHENEFRWLLTVLGLYAQKNNLGKVLGSRFAMRLDALRRGREPDILFVLSENVSKIKETYLDGGADMVIEIVSPESFGRDRGEKFLEYETAKISEYWLIDVERKQAEFYFLDENGRYQPAKIDVQGRFRSLIVKDFRLKVEWLWTLPNELEVLKQLKVI
ncbi:MAG TPA: Uma2 family endonuclease [Pyrinomonadaceae bacterium]|jgi:Uma2 family endonuclease